jgi:hypothetical protein
MPGRKNAFPRAWRVHENSNSPVVPWAFVGAKEGT